MPASSRRSWGPLVELFDGPLTAHVDPAFLAQVQMLDRGLRGVGEAAGGMKTSITGALAPVATIASGITDVGRAAIAAAQATWQLAQRMAQLATEQANLDRNAQRLGLDFDAAAEAAGRFVDETEVMAAANRAAAAGVRLSQEELNALSRTAARFSQDTGRPINQVFEELTQGLLHGTRGLRDFGPGLAALAGPAHTAGERLAEMVRQAERLPPATDDATSAMARFQDSVEDAERTMASAFVAEVARIHEMSTALDGARGDTEDLNLQLRAAGSTAAAMAIGVVALGGAMVGALGAAFAVVVRPMRQTLQALLRASEGDWRGAVGALAGVGDSTYEDARDSLRFAQDSAVVAMTAFGRLGAGERTAEGVGEVAPTSTSTTAAESNADAAARNRRGGGGREHEDPELTRLWARSNAQKLAEDERMALLTGQNRTPANTLGESLSGLSGRVGDFDTRDQEIRDAAERSNAESAREAAYREYRNSLSTRLQGDQESPEARAARDIAGAWGEATEALGAHLGLLVSGQATWEFFWEGVANAGKKALADAATNEGKIEYGRALAALAIGNFPGAALHFAAGTALVGLGAALGSGAGGTPGGGGSHPGPQGGGRVGNPQRVAEVTPREASRDGGPSTVVVNFNGPVNSAQGRADFGRMVRGALRDSTVRQGDR